MELLAVVLTVFLAASGEASTEPQSLERFLAASFEKPEPNCDLWVNPYLASESYVGILVAHRCLRGEGREGSLVAKASKLVVVDAATLETVAALDVPFHAPPVALVEWPGGAGLLQAQVGRLELKSFQGKVLGAWGIPRELANRYGAVAIEPKASFWPRGPGRLLVGAEAEAPEVLEVWELGALGEEGKGVAHVVEKVGEKEKLVEALGRATKYSEHVAELFFRPKVLSAVAKAVLPVERLFRDQVRSDLAHALRAAGVFPAGPFQALLVTQRPLSFVLLNLKTAEFQVIPLGAFGEIVPISAAGSLAGKSVALAGKVAYVHVAGTVVESAEQYAKRKGQPCPDPIKDEAFGETLCPFWVNLVVRFQLGEESPSVEWAFLGDENDRRQVVLLGVTARRVTYLTTGTGGERGKVFLKRQQF